MTQQKDSDPEEYKRLHSEKEGHLKRIQQLTEESNRLKQEATRWDIINDVTVEFLLGHEMFTFSPLFLKSLFLSLGALI